MLEVGLFDTSFETPNTLALGGDNAAEHPKNFIWARDRICAVTFFTDDCLKQVEKANPRVKRVAMLVDVETEAYHHVAFNMEDEFDYILTYRQSWVDKVRSPKWLHYPLGGANIQPGEWGIGEKTLGISMYKHSRGAFRHYDALLSGEVARKASLFGIAVYGSDNPAASPSEFLQDYRYAVVIEKDRLDGYFSSRLIDCLSMGTIPIYWGAPDIGKYFDIKGIVPFSNSEELVDVCINRVSPENYLKAIPAILDNLSQCKQYYCAEDYIYTRYQEQIFNTG